MSIRIKICGITNSEDALLAIDSGADYIGLIFVETSPRAVTIEQAKSIIDNISGKAAVVGVFQNHPLEKIYQIYDALALDYIQLHGDEPETDCLAMPVPVIKKLCLQDAQSSSQSIEEYGALFSVNLHALLLEPPKGTSPSFWNTPFTLPVLTMDNGEVCPYFLAGGLTPDNIESVLSKYQPYGVDVASGVEDQPGIKNPHQVKSFCQKVKQGNKQGGIETCNR